MALDRNAEIVYTNLVPLCFSNLPCTRGRATSEESSVVEKMSLPTNNSSFITIKRWLLLQMSYFRSIKTK